MGDLVSKQRTQLREVDGLTTDMRPDGSMRQRKKKIVFRITKDEIGKSISLCDELRESCWRFRWNPSRTYSDEGANRDGHKTEHGADH